jgi:hypothetical protein
MSKSAPQAPPPPNPALVAQQQTGSNIDTAVAQKALNNTNQYTTLRLDHLSAGRFAGDRRRRRPDLQPDHELQPGGAIDHHRDRECGSIPRASGADIDRSSQQKRHYAADLRRQQSGLSQRRPAVAGPRCHQRGLSAAQEFSRSAMAAGPEGPRRSALAAGHFARERRLQQRCRRWISSTARPTRVTRTCRT